MGCGLITLGSQIDCDDLPQGGTRARIILINHSDILFINETSGLITSITLKATKVAYEFLGFRSDVKKSEEVVKGNLKKKFRHNAGFVIYEIDQPQKNNIKRLSRGRFIAIIETLGKSDNSIELLGKDVGLTIVGGGIRDSDNNLFMINLSTPGGADLEKKLPQSVGVDYETGLEIINDLLNSDTVGLFDYTFDFTFE